MGGIRIVTRFPTGKNCDSSVPSPRELFFDDHDHEPLLSKVSRYKTWAVVEFRKAVGQLLEDPSTRQSLLQRVFSARKAETGMFYGRTSAKLSSSGFDFIREVGQSKSLSTTIASHDILLITCIIIR